MIPRFEQSGLLPPGVHAANWADITNALGFSARRVVLLDGLERAATALSVAGCRVLYLDGSFVTSKESPNDFDGCWEVHGVDPCKLDPVLLDFSNGRAAQKLKYLGELFPANVAATPSGTCFLDFFQLDKATGDPKGIVSMDLTGWTP